MQVSGFFDQTWTLTKKDLLLIARRRWLSTFIRAVAFPIVLTVILASVKNWIHNDGGYGIGVPTPIRPLPEAFQAVGDTRKNFVIVDRGLPGDGVRNVINQLRDMAEQGGRTVRVVQSNNQISSVCPSSSKGVTNCFAAVDFWSSPDSGFQELYNYTITLDSVISGAKVDRDDNSVQLYLLPLQREIDSLIASELVGSGSSAAALPGTILNYPYTTQTQAEVDFEDSKFFGLLVTQAIAFALFIGMAGIAYHLTGHVVRQREEGMLQLIDAQWSGSKSRYASLVSRMLATSLAFNMVYMPAWIVCGVVVGEIIYPASNTGWFVLLYFMAGLAMTSFSILASSLFRRQQLSAISAIVAAIVFAIVAQFTQSGQKSTSTAAALATGLLFPPSTFVYFLVSAAVSEIFSLPLQADFQLPVILNGLLDITIWSLTPAHFLGFFAFQIILYPILAIMIERFLWGSSFKGRHFRSKDEMQGNSLRIKNFTKKYNKALKKSDRTLAVDKLSLDLYAGSITVLLGANGSGKSTTMNCIAGLESITDGEIEIDGSGGIGLCPQKNVMWHDMTVEEHVAFFQKLKNPSLSRAQNNEEVKRLIEGCDLRKKTKAKSKTLSGGQQRKLQLAMMLAGGSQVCCIDEASSGIDPLARRRIWDILLRERGYRTMLLTTHFLDESEVLADHIALLSKGNLRAEGTVASLKSSLGGGFLVTVPGSNLSPKDIPASVTVHQEADATVFTAPDSASLATLLEILDRSGSTNYKVEGPSVEKIFLQLADEMQQKEQQGYINLKKASVASDATAVHSSMSLHAGKPCGPTKQTWALFRKRITILKHNFMPYVASLFVPLVVAALVIRFLLNVSSFGLQCRDPDFVNQGFLVPSTLYPQTIARSLVYGPSSAIDAQQLSDLVPTGQFCYPNSRSCTGESFSASNWTEATIVNSLNDFNQRIDDSANAQRYGIGGFFLTPDTPPVMAWNSDNWGPQSAWNLLAVMDMSLTNASIAVSYNTFAQGYAPRDFYQSLVAVFTTLGFVLFPGLFALYPTRERLQKVRAMHYSNGIMSGPLWTAYALFDFCFLLLIAILVTVIWFTNSYNWYGLGYMFVVFLFYGMAATAYSYVVSLFATSQLAAIAMTCILQAVIAMLFFVACFLTVDMADLSQIYSQMEILFWTIGLICPAVSLMRGLMVVLNVYGISCNGASLSSNPGGITLFGGPILYLVLQFFFLVAFLIFWESGRSLEAFGIRIGSSRKTQPKDSEKEIGSDSDAAEDISRLTSANDGLRVQHISKTFKRNQAIDDVSFGILPSEKFALLGPNGAGKSTMISLIRGDLAPDSLAGRSEIHISGDSLKHTPVAAKQHLGVCPQFDAVDSMTLKEHLEFYARARGVTGKQRDENIHEIVTRLGLTDHTNKLVKKLSGGTKRKLSLGIALIANPSVLLLDEPSSGMDAAAKRALWATLAAISAGRCLLITTHSMEEADALCDRAGIMAGQMLALGTISGLHERFGDKIYIQIVHKEAPRSSLKDVEGLWAWVRRTFLVAETERSVGGQVRFAVSVNRDSSASLDLLDGSSIGNLYRAIETAKEEMGIRDYSVTHATLDQIFLNVASKHGVDEEDSHAPELNGLVSSILKR
ncbi:putative AAA+ ATPase domain, ABC transporter, ABC transporter A [Septoria linicola]|nr:putative AAA+ ATPase domain, ABC transporter, ABC transporter A [Septoria linicola]